MPTHENNYLSEFEQEFEFDDLSAETSHESGIEEEGFEREDDWNTENEFDSEFEIEDEADYLSEFESADDLSNEFEFDTSPEGRYEARLYEIFTANYENEFEFENDFNQVMHEVERDFFWKKIKGWGKRLLPLAKTALKAIPGGGNLMDAVKQITKDPRGLLKTLAMKFGPQALNAIVPGSGVALSAVLGNSELEMQDVARQAARETIALAKEAYTNFADEISRTTVNGTIPQAKTQLTQLARNSFKKAQRTVRLGSRQHRYKRVNRTVRDARNGMYKIVTITYKKV